MKRFYFLILFGLFAGTSSGMIKPSAEQEELAVMQALDNAVHQEEILQADFKVLVERLIGIVGNYNSISGSKSLASTAKRLYKQALIYATNKNWADIVGLLLDNGADVNAIGFSSGSPLHAAAYNGNLELVKYLLSHGANINIGNERHWTPLDFAVDNKQSEVVAYLLNNGANISGRNEEDTGITRVSSTLTPTPEKNVGKFDKLIETAVRLGDWDIVKSLIDHSNDTGDACHMGIIWAICRKDEKGIKYFIKNRLGDPVNDMPLIRQHFVPLTPEVEKIFQESVDALKAAELDKSHVVEEKQTQNKLEFERSENGVRFGVVIGNIAEQFQGADLPEFGRKAAIVIPSNKFFHIEGPVEQAVEKACGSKKPWKYLRNKYEWNSKNGEAYYSPGFGLNPFGQDKIGIIHATTPDVGATDIGNDLCKLYKRCLLCAKENGITDLAFCALGTGKLKANPKGIVLPIVNAIVEELTGMPEPFFKEIRFVIHEENASFAPIYAEALKTVLENSDACVVCLKPGVGNFSVCGRYEGTHLLCEGCLKDLVARSDFNTRCPGCRRELQPDLRQWIQFGCQGVLPPEIDKRNKDIKVESDITSLDDIQKTWPKKHDIIKRFQTVTKHEWDDKMHNYKTAYRQITIQDLKVAAKSRQYDRLSDFLKKVTNEDLESIIKETPFEYALQQAPQIDQPLSMVQPEDKDTDIQSLDVLNQKTQRKFETKIDKLKEWGVTIKQLKEAALYQQADLVTYISNVSIDELTQRFGTVTTTTTITTH